MKTPEKIFRIFVGYWTQRYANDFDDAKIAYERFKKDLREFKKDLRSK